jgi:tRNA-specific 2-thiouridylase
MIRRLFGSSARHINPKIAVAMSGGVDSSVVAYLLRQDHPASELLGVHMSNWDFDDDSTASNQKCWEQDWKDAQAVAQQLEIPLVHTSFQADYWNSVFEPYVQQIARHQRTPNPDIECNRYIKFGVLRDFLRSKYQVKTLATGHYARLWDPTSTSPMSGCLQEVLDQDSSLEHLLSKSVPTLLAARDYTKDQSYFLSGVPGQSFQNVLFPLGDYLKTNPSSSSDLPDTSLSVRQLALEANLPNAHKRDSMGICFVGKRKHAQFVQDYLDAPSNGQVGKCINIVDGSLVTTFHPQTQPSFLYATIGQGAKISGANQKWFVVDRPDAWTLHICPGTHHPALYADSFHVDQLNWISGMEPPLPLKAQCRIRHLQPLVDCEIRLLTRNHGSGGGSTYEIVTAKPLRGIAPGQVCGIYVRDLICLGGGTISQRGPNYMDLQKELPMDLHPAGQNDWSVPAAYTSQSLRTAT